MVRGPLTRKAIARACRSLPQDHGGRPHPRPLSHRERGERTAKHAAACRRITLDLVTPRRVGAGCGGNGASGVVTWSTYAIGKVAPITLRGAGALRLICLNGERICGAGGPLPPHISIERAFRSRHRRSLPRSGRAEESWAEMAGYGAIRVPSLAQWARLAGQGARGEGPRPPEGLAHRHVPPLAGLTRLPWTGRALEPARQGGWAPHVTVAAREASASAAAWTAG